MPRLQEKVEGETEDGGGNRRCREEEKAGRVKNKIKGGRRRWMKKGEYGGRNEKERGGEE